MNAKPHHLRFETERLKNGPVTKEFELEPGFFDLLDDPEYRFEEMVSGELTARLAGEGNVLVTGKVRTVATADCVRCLEGLRIPLNADVTLVYMHDKRLLHPERYPELLEDDTHYFDGECIYPAEQVRENLLLELPFLPACELEGEDFCPVRQVHLPKMVYGPPEVVEKQEEFLAGEEEQDSWKAQLRKLKENME